MSHALPSMLSKLQRERDEIRRILGPSMRDGATLAEDLFALLEKYAAALNAVLPYAAARTLIGQTADGRCVACGKSLLGAAGKPCRCRDYIGRPP